MCTVHVKDTIRYQGTTRLGTRKLPFLPLPIPPPDDHRKRYWNRMKLDWIDGIDGMITDANPLLFGLLLYSQATLLGFIRGKIHEITLSTNMESFPPGTNTTTQCNMVSTINCCAACAGSGWH